MKRHWSLLVFALAYGAVGAFDIISALSGRGSTRLASHSSYDTKTRR